MTKKARLQTKAATSKPTIFLSRPSILQRTCACDGVPGLTGECETCSRQQLSRSPGTTNPSSIADRAANDHATDQSQQSPLSGYSFGKLAISPRERLGVQTKLAIGQPGDRYEQEVDRVAEQVMRMPEPTTIQPKLIVGQGSAFKPANDLQITPRQQSLGAEFTLLARQTWGTSKTTAPPAKNVSPGDVLRDQLKDEVALFANAGVILDWIVSERAAAGGATVTSFTTASLFSDTVTMKRLKPQPKSEAEILPALEMLEFYKVVKRKGALDWDIVLAPLQSGQTQQDVNRTDFDQNRKDITVFQKSFETRFDAKGHPVKQIVQQQLLENSMAAGNLKEQKTQRDAETNLASVTMELDEFVAFRKKGPPIFRVTTDSPTRVTNQNKTSVLLPIAGKKKPMSVDESDFDRIEAIRTGTSPEVEARRKSIETRVKHAERELFNAQAFHRFATEMVWFLNELAKTSSIKFKAGTYPRHGKFGEYAADMYPVINEDVRGFYEIVKAEQFVDAINQVAETGHPDFGKFAWQIVYNDTTLQATINKKYGPRMSSAPHHGPAPDKLHMHLDIRPLNVVADSDTGFRVNPSGRIVLY